MKRRGHRSRSPSPQCSSRSSHRPTTAFQSSSTCSPSSSSSSKLSNMTSGKLYGDNRCGRCGADYIDYYLLPAPHNSLTMFGCRLKVNSEHSSPESGELQAWVDSSARSRAETSLRRNPGGAEGEQQIWRCSAPTAAGTPPRRGCTGDRAP